VGQTIFFCRPGEAGTWALGLFGGGQPQSTGLAPAEAFAGRWISVIFVLGQAFLRLHWMNAV
jgi:hypothetical protein